MDKLMFVKGNSVIESIIALTLISAAITTLFYSLSNQITFSFNSDDIRFNNQIIQNYLQQRTYLDTAFYLENEISFDFQDSNSIDLFLNSKHIKLNVQRKN